MIAIFPIIELVDRYVIAQLKFKKTKKNQSELEFYQQQLAEHDMSVIKHELDQLYIVHDNIWNLESELRSGLENSIGYEELGKRAVKIRDWNHRRIELKNIMADKLGQGHIHEIKQDHLSE
jgi:hypothetical protein